MPLFFPRVHLRRCPLLQPRLHLTAGSRFPRRHLPSAPPPAPAGPDAPSPSSPAGRARASSTDPAGSRLGSHPRRRKRTRFFSSSRRGAPPVRPPLGFAGGERTVGGSCRARRGAAARRSAPHCSTLDSPRLWGPPHYGARAHWTRVRTGRAPQGFPGSL